MENFFKQRRTELGLTQLQISRALDMTTSAVSAWESFENPPKIALAPELAAVYQVSESRIAQEIGKLASQIRSRRKQETVA